MRTPPSGGPARYARTRASSAKTPSPAATPTANNARSTQRRTRTTFLSYRGRRNFPRPPCQPASTGAMSAAVDLARQDQFDAMIQGLRDSADLLERLGSDIAVRRILVDVLGDLLEATMGTVRFVASALLE